jgi:signal transduction histidine kinase
METLEQILPPTIEDQQMEKTTSPEIFKEYRTKAVRALMWLSADLKNWLASYGSTEEEIAKAVQERPINAKINRYNKLLTFFTDLLRLDEKPPEMQKDLQADWNDFVFAQRKTPENELFEIFQELPVDEENIDSADFIDELKAFKHDLMSPTGALGLVSEYQQIQHDEPRIASLSETAKNLNFSFAHLREKLLGIIDNQVNKRTVITAGELANIVSEMYKVLLSFNIDNGGEVAGEVPASEVWEFIRETVLELNKKFPQVTITLENNMAAPDATRLVPLNKSLVFRLLLNTVSNTQKSKADAHVTVTLASSSESTIIAVRDDGTGFPSEEPDAARIFLDFPLKLYSVAEGRTQWQSAKGTGSGLFGLSNLAKRLGGELVTGNYYHGEEKLGAMTAFVVPFRQP